MALELVVVVGLLWGMPQGNLRGEGRGNEQRDGTGSWKVPGAKAQDAGRSGYQQALREIRGGRKSSHWSLGEDQG